MERHLGKCPNLAIVAWIVLAASADVRAKVIDLRHGPAGKHLQALIEPLAQGNEGSAEVIELTADSKTGELRGKVSVRHRHTWGNLFGQEIVVYDDTMTGDFHYNVRQAVGDFDLDLGRGVRLNTERIRRLLDGDLRVIPEMLPNFGVVTKEFDNEYDPVRDRYRQNYGAGNVFFASRGFVDWASADTAGNWVLEAIVTGGAAAVGHALKQAKEHALGEANQLSAWLQQKGHKEAATAAQLILSGKKLDWPFLAIKFDQVNYRSRTLAAGKPITPWITSPHATFVIIWRMPTALTAVGNVQADAHVPPVITDLRKTWAYVENGGGYFQAQGNLQRGTLWVEKTRTGENKFVEVTFSAHYADLYDGSRGLYVRLLDKACYLSKDLKNWRLLYRGAWRTQAAAGDHRDLWCYKGNGLNEFRGSAKPSSTYASGQTQGGGGYFQNTKKSGAAGKELWLHHVYDPLDPSDHRGYVLSERTPDHVELRDGSRPVWVRLRADSCLVSYDHKNWTPIHHGSWR